MTSLRVTILVLVLALALPALASAGVRVVARDEPVGGQASARVLGADVRTLPARAAPIRFNLAGLHWQGTGVVWFRTARRDGGWSAWRHAQPEDEDSPDPGSAENRARAGWRIGNPYWTGPATRIQYRTRGRVARLRAFFLWSAPRPVPAARRLASPGQPPILTRKQWGADESIVRGSPSYASQLAFSVVHHTAGAKPTSPSQSAAVVRGVLSYHVRSNGWNDIGYNFLVDSFGQIFEGRAGGITRNVIGAHAGGFNTGSVGVAILGTYTSATITPAARDALTNLLAWRLDLAHVDPVSRLVRTSGGNDKFPAGTPVTLAAVSGHRDTGNTSCPGTALYATLGSLAGEVLVRGGPKIVGPRVQGSLGGPIRFTARLTAALPWTVTVLNGAGSPVASGGGTDTKVDWTWNATTVPADRYTYSIDAGADVRPVRAPLDGTVPLELTGLSVSPGVVTPNGDGVADTAAIGVTVTKEATLALRLEDSSGSSVATITTSRALAAGRNAVVWNGKAAAGRAVADGRYTVVAEVTSGSEHSSRTGSIVVDRTLGRLAVSPTYFSPNGDGRRERVAVSFELVKEATVQARVLAGSRVVATLLPSGRRGPGRQTLAWDGREAGRLVADGRLRLSVDATTTLGRRSLAKELVLDTRPPRIGILAARRDRGSTLLRLRLSEPARLAIRFGRTIVRLSRGAGVRTIRRRGVVGSVTISAQDSALNATKPVTVRVRRR